MEGPGPENFGIVDIRWEVQGCCATMRVAGEIDLSNVGVFARYLSELGQSQAGHLLVECSQLSFIDSTGLKALIEAWKEFDGRAALVAPSLSFQKLIEIAGVAELLTAFDTMNTAMASIHGASPEKRGA